VVTTQLASDIFIFLMFCSYSSGLTLIPFHRSISYINSSRETAFRSFHVFLGRNTDVHIILLIFSVRNKSCLLLSETSTFSLPQLTSCSYCEHCLCCLLLLILRSSSYFFFPSSDALFQSQEERKDKGRFVLYDGLKTVCLEVCLETCSQTSFNRHKHKGLV